MNLAWMLCLLAWTQSGQSIYHEDSASWLRESLDNKDSHFGYSVTYEPASKRLVVSAPKATQIGEIYSCDLAARKDQCTKLPLPPAVKDPLASGLYSHNYWYGATVKAGPSYVVTCAPLYVDQLAGFFIKPINQTKLDKSKEYGTFSRCFKFSELNSETPVYSALKRLSLKDRQSHVQLLEHAMDSLGWSIDVDGDDIIIGGPAMFTGRAAKYGSNSGDPISLTGYVNEKISTNYERRVNYNFGYSVAVGYFSMNKDKIYAIGSPYGQKGLGKVSFYRFANGMVQLNSKISSTKDLITSDPFAVGSMFGAVLCAAQLTNASSASTLLVGAPAYASTQVNQGAVYFYAPNAKLPLKTWYRKIVGTKSDAFFGSAIVRLGDYNGDGMDEIAIAAPYENAGEGVVYIYSSRDTSITNKKAEIKWIQKIVPSSSEPRVRSFGLALSAVQDYDDNGCNELAIGAPEDNTVMVLNCIASVTVRIRTEIPKDLSLQDGVINPFRNENLFIFESCFDMVYPEKPHNIYAHINVTVQIVHKSAKLEEKEKPYEIFIKRAEKVVCRNITVLAPKNGNYQHPVHYIITATQLNPPEQSKVFNASHVALTDLSKLTDSGYIWLIECADKDHCKPNLTLTDSVSVTMDSPYVLGSPEKVTLNVTLKNDGETAYEVCVRVNPSDGMHVLSVPGDCERPPNQQELKCKPRGALRKEDDAWSILNIPFDLSSFDSNHESASISIAVDETCKNANLTWKHIPIPLKADLRSILVEGILDSGVSSSVNMSKDEFDGKTFEHSYTITSGGLTNWVNVEVTVVRQNRSFIDYGPIYISSGDSPADQCLKTAENETIFTCQLDRLNSKLSAKITIPMKIVNPEMLEMAITEKENTLFTLVTIKLNDVEERHDSVTTEFYLGGQLNVWIIVAASLVGLLLLLLIVYGLTKCGFFKRENKKELENVRRSIRRQTIMRRTMMEGVRPPPGDSDRRSLLASVPQETAVQAAARDKRVRLDSNATRKK